MVTQTSITILFADVADSVGLHDALGDIVAHRKIVDCLNRMSDIITQHHGQVIETIGDEIMCTFPHPDQALHAACSIQEVLQNNPNYDLNVRVGFNHDKTNVDDGHPFGDTVNVAARMVSIAKAGQIIISTQAREALSESCRKQTRHFNRLQLKGKQEPCDIYEVLWDRDHSTIKFSHADKLNYNRYRIKRVDIKYLDVTKYVKINQDSLEIGRGNTCQLIVFTDVVSRLHATITTENNKIVFTDQSTNGSYIHTRSGSRATDDQDLYLHHDEWIMSSSGTISLGEPTRENKNHLIHFQCS